MRANVKKIYGIVPKSKLSHNLYDGIVIAVAHEKFKKIGYAQISNYCKKNHVIYDLKYIFSKDKDTLRL